MHRFKTPLALVAIAALMIPVVACARTETAEEAPAAEPEPAVVEAVSFDRAILADPSRPEGDLAQDEGRKALDVYEFVGIEPGMTVADLFPGGVVGIVEVDTPNKGWHEDTHRLNKQVVITDFMAGGFELVDESDELLANPDDDHSESGFPNRHTMDRYVLKFQKPAM